MTIKTRAHDMETQRPLKVGDLDFILKLLKCGTWHFECAEEYLTMAETIEVLEWNVGTVFQKLRDEQVK